MRTLQLVLGLVLLLVSPASADLVFRDSVPQSVRPRFTEVWQKMPARAKLPDVDVLKPGTYTADVPAFYSYDNDNIVLGPDMGAITDLIFAHEYGHHVFFKTLTDEEKYDWQVFWEGHKAAMPTKYARTSMEEGFAECFSLRYWQGQSLRRSVRRKLREYFGE